MPVQFNEEVEMYLEANTNNDITGLMTNPEKYKNLQLNLVYKIFQNAKKEILE